MIIDNFLLLHPILSEFQSHQWLVLTKYTERLSRHNSNKHRISSKVSTFHCKREYISGQHLSLSHSPLPTPSLSNIGFINIVQNRDVLSLILVYQYQFPYNSKWSTSSELISSGILRITEMYPIMVKSMNVVLEGKNYLYIEELGK